MNTVTLGLASRDIFSARAIASLEGQPQGAFISFETLELLVRILTPMRWEIIKIMTGAGSLQVEEVARRLGGDLESVNEGVRGLVNAGVLDRNDDGSIECPHDAIHVDFWLRAA